MGNNSSITAFSRDKGLFAFQPGSAPGFDGVHLTAFRGVLEQIYGVLAVVHHLPVVHRSGKPACLLRL